MTTLQGCQARSFPLPPELLLEIFGYLHDCQPALHSASLVSKQWLYCVAPILYSRPQINDTYRWATFILTLTRERMSFFYGDLIRSIDLSSGKSIVEAMKDQEFYRRLSNSTDDPSHRPIHLDNNNRRTHIRLNGSIRFQQDQQEYLLKGLPFIIVSTSSLVQISHTCKNITCLNLSYTSLLYDSLVAETGEYLSTLQRYAVQPGLTHIQIPIEQAIQSIGKECVQLQQVKIQRCEWVTAHVIWMFVYYCNNLKKLDARRSTKCTVKRLIAGVLEDTSYKEETGLYEQVEDPTQARITVVRPYTEEMENDAFWFVPFTTTNEETRPIGQRPPSPMHPYLTQLNAVGNQNKSLKNIVHDILLDAKELGAIDINWLQDY
ncbi:hypothetical protein INT48_005045 [Thamnidium elegans]|uniref:F-box domain-containing protein n=1 Tax=Thamnidium elegans TaxID=101142 RepID=A0A8H7SLQ4_9FUNG|nr:hypothetical protein INT48_005045 [Thamnidium elegans]